MLAETALEEGKGKAMSGRLTKQERVKLSQELKKRATRQPHLLPGERKEAMRLSKNLDAINAAESKRTKKKPVTTNRSEEHTSELQSLMRISYAVFCLKK